MIEDKGKSRVVRLGQGTVVHQPMVDADHFNLLFWEVNKSPTDVRGIAPAQVDPIATYGEPSVVICMTESQSIQWLIDALLEAKSIADHRISLGLPAPR